MLFDWTVSAAETADPGLTERRVHDIVFTAGLSTHAILESDTHLTLSLYHGIEDA